MRSIMTRARTLLVGLAALVLVLGCGSPAGNNADGSPDTPGAASGSRDVAAGAQATVIESVMIAGETFALELAADDATRARGLMFRTEIAPHGGMLFAFPYASVQEFWMGNCWTDMDIVFVDPLGRVTATHSMTAVEPQQPGESDEEYAQRVPRYSSRLPAQFVLELAVGTAERLGIGVLDTLDLDVKRLARIAR